MFVRLKKHRSGNVSVVIVDKSGGKARQIKSFGIVHSESHQQALVAEARQWIMRHGGQQQFDFGDLRTPAESIDYALSQIRNIHLDTPYRLLSRIYDEIGFNAIHDDILRHLVIARVCEPQSKLATVAYLKSYFDEDVSHYRIYRYMDKLYNTQQEQVQQISVEHTRKILGGNVGLLFYDVTTLYFEAAPKNDMRQAGFSKDGKTSEAQIVLGLLVSQAGYPLSYSIFNGSQYEGYTMIPVIDDFVQRFALTDFVIVADSGLMSAKNIQLLQKAGYKYIIGARIHNESESMRQWILSLPKAERLVHECRKANGDRLIVNYSESRAEKDAYNRKKGIERLQKAYRSGKLTKENINKRGYNKFLSISKDVEVTIDESKIAEDAQWDGLKGYITNTNLPQQEVINQYHGLWVVERAFRISKGNLQMRPIFHFTEKRIEAHICICFVAYKIYKELERQLPQYGIKWSVDKVLSIAKTIPTIKIKLPNGEIISRTMTFTDEQHQILPLLPH